jgi:TatD DNase family protein
LDKRITVQFMAIALAVKEVLKESIQARKSMPEMADAHCHIESFPMETVRSSIERGVSIIIANGVDTASNIKTLAMSDGKNIFAALGVHPEYAGMPDDELEKNIALARSNRKSIIAIGEIGIDKKYAGTDAALERQKYVFSRFVELAVELGLPVCVHSRNALDEIFMILEEKGAKRVQLHFFEGDEKMAIEAESRGYAISVPPMESSRRMRAIKAVSMASLLAETDSPVNGSVPRDVEKSIRIIAAAKGVPFEDAAVTLVQNTRRFFNIGVASLMR